MTRTTKQTAPPMTTLSRDWLSVAQAAQYLDYHPVTIRRFIKDGTLPASRLNERGKLRIPASAVEKILESTRVKP